MIDVVYTTVPGKIPALLSKIKDVGIPPKVTQAWLKTIGFTSSNDGSLVGVLRVAGLIDQSGVPTERWSRFRGPRGKAALGEGIMQGYSNLYSVYSDAHQRANIDLEHVFGSSTKAGKQAIQKAVSTFKKLVEEAEFGEPAEDAQTATDSPILHAPVSDRVSASQAASNSNNPSLHIDVQVHISADASPDQIDQIFASMAKHLYGRE